MHVEDAFVPREPESFADAGLAESDRGSDHGIEHQLHVQSDDSRGDIAHLHRELADALTGVVADEWLVGQVDRERPVATRGGVKRVINIPDN